MQIQSYNTRAAGEALKLLGGETLVNLFVHLYTALDKAEAAGFNDGFLVNQTSSTREGFDDGYDSGYADGHADGYTDILSVGDQDDTVRHNAMVEGCALKDMPCSKWLEEVGGWECVACEPGCAECKGQTVDFEVMKAAVALDEGEYRGG